MSVTTFGERLGRLCAASGASYSTIDVRAGLGRGHTAQLVSGVKGDPMLATAVDLARALGLTRTGMVWLFSGAGRAPGRESVLKGFQRSAHVAKVRHPAVPRQGYDRARATESGASR